jgi:dTDP-4-amino-4,6-dideoxygalactose transaminase
MSTASPGDVHRLGAAPRFGDILPTSYNIAPDLIEIATTAKIKTFTPAQRGQLFRPIWIEGYQA